MIKPISHKSLMLKSRAWRNFCAYKRVENIQAAKSCQLFSDETEKNRLDYTPKPEIPKVEVKKNTHVRWDLFFLGVLKENIKQLTP